MERVFLRFACVLVLVASGAIPAFAAGGSCGGGGSVIEFPDQDHPFLLDLLTSDDTSLADISAVDSTKARPKAIPSSPPDLGPMLPSDQAVIDLAKLRLENWRVLSLPTASSAGALADMIKSAIDQMSFVRSAYRFNVIPRYWLPDSLKGRNPSIQTAVLFYPLYGAILSVPVWDQLDRETQAGLVIHEALREIQMGYLMDDLTDEQLQSIVASIMRRKPTSAFLELVAGPNSMFERVLWLETQKRCQFHPDPSCPTDIDPASYMILDLSLGFEDSIEATVSREQQRRVQDIIAPGAPSDAREALVKELMDQGILRR